MLAFLLMTGMTMSTQAKIIAPYKPLPWQIEPWRDKSLVMLLTGSAGGGKSRVAAEKVHAYLKKYPKATGLALRKTRESMTSGTVLFFERRIIGPDPQVRHIQSKHRFEYANGSILSYGGMADEKQREQIRSIGQDGSVDIAWLEEANKFVEDDYNELLTRLRGRAAPWRQLILSTNPDSPHHWIYKRLLVGGEAKTYTSRAKDNPYNSGEYLQTLDKLTGVLRDRLRDGMWVQAEGVVYADYDEDVHLIDRFEIPRSWARYRSIDFGYENPFVCQWWAVDEDKRLYRYREIYRTHRIVAEHAQEINRLSQDEQITATVADHDAEDRATLTKAGILTLPAQKAVSVGIQATMQRFKANGDQRPRIFFLRDSLVEADPELKDLNLPTCTEEEITLYSWARGSGGAIVKDEPVKQFDHGMDPMRYMVMNFENAPSSIGQPKTRSKPVTAGMRSRRF